MTTLIQRGKERRCSKTPMVPKYGAVVMVMVITLGARALNVTRRMDWRCGKQTRRISRGYAKIPKQSLLQRGTIRKN